VKRVLRLVVSPPCEDAEVEVPEDCQGLAVMNTNPGTKDDSGKTVKAAERRRL